MAPWMAPRQGFEPQIRRSERRVLPVTLSGKELLVIPHVSREDHVNTGDRDGTPRDGHQDLLETVLGDERCAKSA